MDQVDENGLLPGEVELWRNRQWRVTTTHLETLPETHGYWVLLSNLERGNWLAHLSEKRWVDIAALKEALAMVGKLTPFKPNLQEGQC